MSALTRRHLLAGAATFGATALLDRSRALAAAPPAGKQAPGFYRYKVGDYEITQVVDGARTFPMPDTFVVNVKKEEALAAAEEAYIPKGQVTIPFNPMVVNTGSKLIVIDTETGSPPSIRRRAGKRRGCPTWSTGRRTSRASRWSARNGMAGQWVTPSGLTRR